MELEFGLKIIPINSMLENGVDASLFDGDIIFYEKKAGIIRFTREFQPICLYDFTNKKTRQEIISSCNESQFVEFVELLSAITGKPIREIKGGYIPDDWIAYRISKQPTAR